MSERDDDMGRVLGLLEQVRDGIWDAVEALQEANVIQDERQTVQDAPGGADAGCDVESSWRMSERRLRELEQSFDPEGHADFAGLARELYDALLAERCHCRDLERHRAKRGR